MWIPTEQDAIEMFAAHFAALHRSGAADRAEDKASELRAAGDAAGQRIWKQVANRVREIRKETRVSQRQTGETGSRAQEGAGGAHASSAA